MAMLRSIGGTPNTLNVDRIGTELLSFRKKENKKIKYIFYVGVVRYS
jgi:hypothetical protein